MQEGYEVIASSRKLSGTLEQELGMPITELDVLKPISLNNDIDNVDTIIHCATANDVLSRDFEAGVNLSVYGTRNILNFAVARGVKRIIFFSTLQVYGTELIGKISEDTPVCCQSPYALNHFYGEELCRMYARNHGLDVVLMRPSNVYGIPDVSTVRRDSLVPMCFVKEAIQNGSLTLRSSGRQQRNFISTDEVANVCLNLLRDFPQGCEVINLGSSWLTSIHDIAEITKKIYLERYGEPLQMNILSNEPKEGNSFTIVSRVASVRPLPEESRQAMINVITQIFDNNNFQKEMIHDNK
jgi:nucleoside-diphosphate-sugar epimerase